MESSCNKAKSLTILLCLYTLHIEIIVKGNEVPGTACGGIAKCLCRKTQRYYEMDCSNRSLYDVPEDIPSNVTKIDLSMNNLTSIHWNAFITATKLKALFLQNNVINSVSEEIFAYNKKIKLMNSRKKPWRLIDSQADLSQSLGTHPFNVHVGKLLLNNTLARRHTLLSAGIEPVTFTKTVVSCIYFQRMILEEIKMMYQTEEKTSYFSLCLSSKLLTKEMLTNLSQTLKIDLSHNKLVELPEKLVQNNVKLQSLLLSNNEIECLHEDVVYYTPTIKVLDLAHNKLVNLSETLFWKTLNMTSIQLSRNLIEEIPERMFVNLINLKRMDMTRNKIHFLRPRTFSSLSKVNQITIGRNRISHIHIDTFSWNIRATDIDISHNLISAIQQGIFRNNENLKNLDISYNELRYLPEDLISNCSDLRALHLGNNQLSTIPTGFFRENPKIEFLTMSNNKFQILNKAYFHGLTSIHYLTLSGNCITSLPVDVFGELQLDCYLDLSQNLLSEIPDGLWKTNTNYHQLQFLLLQRNNLTFLSNTSFSGLQNLREIYLFENSITELTNDSFGSGVSHIHLYKNNISYISESALRSMSSATIYLTCENLHQIPSSKNTFFGFCVRNAFVPVVTFRADRTVLISFFQKQGFMCQKFGRKEKCRPCAPGRFADGNGMCRECPRGGFYQDEIGSQKCKNCSNGNFVKDGGGFSALDCTTCPDGTNHSRHAGFRACFCKTNYTRIDRFELCRLCLEEGLNCTNDFKSLLPGYYWNWSFTGMNLSLYSSFVTNLLTLDDNYDLSTTKYIHTMPRVFKCPRPKSCANSYSHTSTGINGNCQEGYRGWLCSKCQNTFYSVLRYCAPCQQKWWIISEMIMTMSACLLIIILVIWKNTKPTQQDKRLFVDKLSSRMKIFLGFYQVVGDLYESVNVVSWTGPLRYVGKLISFVSLNLLKIIIRPQCLDSRLLLDPIIRFNIAVIFPIGIIVVTAWIYLIFKVYLQCCKKTANAENMVKLDKIKSKILTYVVLILFITYQPTCDAIFEIYPGACDTFVVDREGNITISLLRADYDINCKSIAHYQTEAYIATVLYVIAYPLILLILLRKYCRKLTEKKVITEINNDDCCNNSLCANEMTPLLSGHQATCRTIPTCLKFLSENYKEQFWFWEILELGRKVGQTMLITLLGWEDALTKLFTIGTSVLFLYLHVKYSPMKSPFEQHLQLFSLIAIFLNILVAAVPVAVQYQATISTLLVLLDVGIVLAVAGEVLLVLLRFVREKVTLNTIGRRMWSCLRKSWKDK
ncbi:uncharacterized protein [Apostichopus japonicus]|uniref:uncharacterized protein isoform X2 n=1 Tax=Stichopus japonicus TaxID=307972 RepID=UPI003AB358A2